MKTKRINNININGTTYEVGGKSIEVVQESGDSTEAVMSQNAVTEFVDTLDGRVAEAEEDIGFVKNRLGLLIADRTAIGNGTQWNVPSNALEYASIVKIGGLTRTVPGAVVNLVPIEKNPNWNDTGVTVEALGNNRYRFNGTCNSEWGSGFTIEDYDNVVTAYDGETWYTSAKLVSGYAFANGSYVSPQASAHSHNMVYLSDTVGDVTVGSTTFNEGAGEWGIDVAGVYLGFENGATFNDAVYEFKIGKEMGEGGKEPTIITTIVSGGITIPIPDAVKNMGGYGHGIDANCYNYIDAENGVYVHMCDYQMGEVVPISTTTTKLPTDFAEVIAQPIKVTADSVVQFVGGSAQYEIDYQVKV